MNKVEILGIKIDNLSLQEVLENCKAFLDSNEPHYIVTPNPEFLVAAQNDENFHEILNYADLAIADGIGLIHAANFLKKKLVRVTGVDLVWSLSELAEQKNCSIYFLGGNDLVAAQTAEYLKEQYPNLIIAGAESGGYIDDPKFEDKDLIERINDSKPDIILVAFGQVKQEKWIYYNLDKLPTIKLAVGIGGAFDYLSGNIPRAPKLIRQLGFEWLYRLIKEPKRWKRIFNATIIFPWLVFKEKYFIKK